MESKSFIKYAGGKTQLLPEIYNRLPPDFSSIKTYIEPFLGGGSVFFSLDTDKFDKCILIEKNKNLCTCFSTIKNNVNLLIEALENLSSSYKTSENPEKFFYDKRKEYNETSDDFTKSYLLIYLNKVCFNGLFRTNKSGNFNSPWGKSINKKILDKEKLLLCHSKLQNAEIICDDFSKCLDYAGDRSFVYLDPPYRPISKSSNFVGYTDAFDDQEQKRLKDVFDILSKKNRSLCMLSNSDPKNTDTNDNFFDDLYADYNIDRVLARRNINSKSSKRHSIFELLIRNYK
jgi:DNA adenine methylase